MLIMDAYYKSRSGDPAGYRFWAGSTCQHKTQKAFKEHIRATQPHYAGLRLIVEARKVGLK